MLPKEVFDWVIKLIQDPAKKEFLSQALKKIPDYFWIIPASSTGKYHPAFAVEQHGLIKHSLAAVIIALDIFEAYPELTQDDQDDILVALVLHDSVKKGYPEQDHTVEGHETLPREYFMDISCLLPIGDYERIMSLIYTHMGIWNQNKIPPAPRLGYRISPAEIVHLADYLSSRKSLERIFRDHRFVY